MKKSICLILVAMIILSTFATVNAEVELNRAWICDCGGYVTLQSTHSEGWVSTGARGECPHGNIDHNPVKQKKVTTKKYACDSCSVEDIVISTDYRTTCK